MKHYAEGLPSGVILPTSLVEGEGGGKEERWREGSADSCDSFHSAVGEWSEGKEEEERRGGSDEKPKSGRRDVGTQTDDPPTGCAVM